MNPQRDDELLRRYREASDELDERPGAPARAAILAAAAREIGARPVDAAQPAPRPRLRWPWAAAAAVMLSTLAVLLATHTEKEQPTFTLPAEPAREAARETTAPQPMTQAEPAEQGIAESKPATQGVDARRSAAADSKSSSGPITPPPATPAPAPLRKENRQTAAEEPPVARSKAEGIAGNDAATEARSRAATAPAPPAASPPSSAPTTAEAAAGMAGGLQAPAAERQGRIEPSQPRLDSSAKPRAMAAKQAAEAADAANDSDRAEVERRPEDWLQKIIRLRTEGRHDEAEAELKRFRERYPQWQLPPAALAPTGTR